MWKEIRRLGGLVENENKIKRIKNKKIRENVFRWIFLCCYMFNSHPKYIFVYVCIYLQHICCSQFDLDFSCIEIDIIDMMKKNTAKKRVNIPSVKENRNHLWWWHNTKYNVYLYIRICVYVGEDWKLNICLKFCLSYSIVMCILFFVG